MRKIILILVSFILILSCEKNNVKIIDPSQIDGKWTITGQYLEGNQIDSYTQIHKGMNFNNEILWIDTVKFGLSTFSFSTGGSEIFNTFNLKSDKIRELYGRWKFSANKDSIIVNSMITEYMTNDTIINGHLYQFFDFIYLQYKIEELNESHLTLLSDQQKIILEKL